MKEQNKKSGDELISMFTKPANTNVPEAANKKVVVPKKLDAPAEALLGLLNGTLVGGLMTSVGSATYSFATKKPVWGTFKNTQLGVVLGGTAAVGLINALVRTSHALKHNTWCDTVNEKTGHLERLEAEKAKPNSPQKG